MISVLQTESLYQENVLQTTRSLHYTFQSLLLAIAYASLTIGFSALFSESLESSKLITIFFILLGECVVIKAGFSFLNNYSDIIYKRGLIIDFLHHLVLMEHSGKRRILEQKLFKKTNNNYMFSLIKVLERVINAYKEPAAINSYLKNLSKRTTDSDVEEPLFTLEKKFELLFSWKDPFILPYILFSNDIYYCDYLSRNEDGSISFAPQMSSIDKNGENLTPEVKVRSVSDSRQGHKQQFRKLWDVVCILNFLLWVFFLVEVFFFIFRSSCSL